MYVIQAGQYLFPLFIIPLLLHTIGTNKYGEIIIAGAIAQYLSSLADFGFGLTGTRAAALTLSSASDLQDLYTSIQASRWILFLTGCLAIGIFTAFDIIPQNLVLLVFFACIGTLNTILLPQWYLQATGHLYYIAITQAIAKSITILGIIILVKKPDDQLIAAFLLFCTPILTTATGCAYLHHSRALPSYNQISTIKIIDTLQHNWNIFIAKFAIELYTSTNTIIISIASTTNAVAYFYVAERIVRGIQSLAQPVVQGYFPIISALTQSNKHHALSIIRRLSLYLLLFSTLSTTSILLHPYFFIDLLYGSTPEDAILTIQILSINITIITISNIYGQSTLLAFGYERIFSRVLLFAGLTGPLLIAAFSSALGASGASIAVVLIETLVSTLMFLAATSKGLNPFDFRTRRKPS